MVSNIYLPSWLGKFVSKVFQPVGKNFCLSFQLGFHADAHPKGSCVWYYLKLHK